MGQDHNIKPAAQEAGRPEITWGQTDLRAAHFDWPLVEPDAGTSFIDVVESMAKNNTGGMGLEALLEEAQVPPDPVAAPVPLLAPPMPVATPPELLVRPPVEPGLLAPPVLPGLPAPPVDA